MCATHAGNGQYLWLELDVIEGPHQGRKFWDQLNLVNPSPQTVEIAQRTLSAICHAVGQMQASDSEALHFRPLQITIAVEADGRNKHLPPHEQRKQNRVKGCTQVGGVSMAVCCPGAIFLAIDQPRRDQMHDRHLGVLVLAFDAAQLPPWRTTSRGSGNS